MLLAIPALPRSLPPSPSPPFPPFPEVHYRFEAIFSAMFTWQDTRSKALRGEETQTETSPLVNLTLSLYAETLRAQHRVTRASLPQESLLVLAAFVSQRDA